MSNQRICYQKRRLWKYRLKETCQVQTKIKEAASIPGVVELTSQGLLTIYAKYAWDGPSGPTFDTPSFMRGSLIHDALYQLMREGKLDPDQHREAADEILRDICLEDGMPRVRAWWVYRGVRRGGARAAQPDVICLNRGQRE